MISQSFVLLVLSCGYLVAGSPPAQAYYDDASGNYFPTVVKAGSRSAARNPGLPCANLVLPPFCQISADCLSISCNVNFAGQIVAFSFGINKCDSPLSVTVSAQVSAINLDVTHTMTTGMKLPIPGFSVHIPGLFKAGVFKEITLTPQGDGLFLKCEVLGGGKIFGIPVWPLRLTFLNHKLPLQIEPCGGGGGGVGPPPPGLGDSSDDQ